MENVDGDAQDGRELAAVKPMTLEPLTSQLCYHRSWLEDARHIRSVVWADHSLSNVDVAQRLLINRLWSCYFLGGLLEAISQSYFAI